MDQGGARGGYFVSEALKASFRAYPWAILGLSRDRAPPPIAPPKIP